MSFWIHQPSILFNSKHITEIWPYSYMSKDDKLNAITRFVILISLFGFMCINRFIIIILGLIVIGSIVLLYKSQKEGYISSYYPVLDESKTNITDNNPFNNVLLTDYKYNPQKEESNQEYTPDLEKKINDAAKQSILEQNVSNTDMIYMFGDDKSNFEFEQSMRPFHSTASTTIPNTQDKFLEFCYGKLPSEKPLTIY